MKKIYTLLFVLSISVSVYSQQNPRELKWMEINTDHAKFIFPKEIGDQAQKAANLIDYLYAFETKSLVTRPKKLPVILYNQSLRSNGFAGLRPRRSVWYSTPPQFATDLGTNDWYYSLGTHEFRHIVQYSKIDKHFTKFMSTIFGQTGLLMGEYSIPYWFFEGDAICMETGLSDGGRGRISQFEMPIRTILLNDKMITYDQAKFRSYKTFYPSHYNLGWLLASKARVLYGYDVWDKTLTHTSKISFWPYAFSRGLKKTTGLNEKQLYNKVMDELKKDWSEDLSNIEVTNILTVTTEKKNSWTKYTEVNYVNENTFLAKKSSLKGDITALYLIDRNGNETKLKATDADLLSVSGNKVVWARKYSDPRWQLRNYSDVILFDIKTRKEKRLTKKQKLLAPSLSNDGKKIVAVEYNEQMQSKLVFLDSKSGKQYKEISFPDYPYIRTPEWNESDDKLVFTLSNRKGTALCVLNLNDDELTYITDYDSEPIGRPFFYKNHILYNSPYSGIGNIYAIDIKTKERHRVISAKFGVYNPKVFNDKLCFINYTHEGYDIAEIDIDGSKWVPIEKITEYTFKSAEIIQDQEQGKNVLDLGSVPNKTFEIKKYRHLRHAINIHSWGFTTNYPTEYDLESLQNFRPDLGFELYSANLMNTVFGVAGINYDINEETFGTRLSAIFKKYYPEFSISGAWAQRSINYTDSIENRWDELTATADISLPIDLSSGIYYRGMNLNTAYSYTKTENKGDRWFISETVNGNFSSLTYTASAHNFRRQANQDINPKFGQFLYFRYKHTPFNDYLNGNQFSVYTSLYFPGIFKHHSLNIKGGYEKQREEFDANYYWFGSPQAFPRGHNYRSFDRFQSIYLNYSFPVWYPDFNIGPIIYFKRLRANLFYDYADINGVNSDNTQNYQSAGAELFLQVYLLRLGAPIELGFRLSYLLNMGEDEQSLIPDFLVLGIPF